MGKWIVLIDIFLWYNFIPAALIVTKKKKKRKIEDEDMFKNSSAS